MSEEYSYDDDYDQEYAEGYSAYEDDNEYYDSEYEDGYEDGYTDGYEDAEEDYVDEYVEEYVDDDDDVRYEELQASDHKKSSHSAGTDAHHIMRGATGAAMGHAVMKKAATKRRQQQHTEKSSDSANDNMPATNGMNKGTGIFVNICLFILSFTIFLFFFLLLFKCCR